jgi:hypothetical protein
MLPDPVTDPIQKQKETQRWVQNERVAAWPQLPRLLHS